MDWKDITPVVGVITLLVGTLCWVVKKLVSKFSTDMCATQAATGKLLERVLTAFENHMTHNSEATAKHTVAIEQLAGHIDRQTAAVTRFTAFVEKLVNGKHKKR